MMDARLKTLTEELLGLRPGAAEKRAVRFSDLKNGLAGVGGGFNAETVRKIAETVARDVAEGYDGANVDLGQLQAEIDAARAEANAARADVINAISAANAAQAYADALVAAARTDFSADFSQAISAAQDALNSATAAQLAQGGANDARTAAEAAALLALSNADATTQDRIASQTARSQAQVARDGAVVARDGAQGAQAAANTSAGIAASAASDAQGQAGNAANSATASATSAGLAGVRANAAESSAVASEQSRLQAVAARDGAQIARSGADIARDAAVTAKQDAEGAASTATTQASLATTARNQAGSSASAAASSATAAASSANAAGQNASAAESSRLSAEVGAASALPSAIGSGTSWTHSLTGSPEAVLGWPGNFSASIAALSAGVATIKPAATVNIHLVSRAVLPWIPGRTMRVTVDMRMAALTSGRVRGLIAAIGPNYANVSNANPATLLPTVANQWQNISYDYVIPANSGAAYFRAGLFVVGATASPGDVDVRSILIEDVTESIASGASRASAEIARDAAVVARQSAEGAQSAAQTSANLAAQSRTDAAGFADAAGTARTQAQNSATAAAGSASTAATQATNAGSSATAANSARIAAEAARDGANAASASAGINRDQAVTARQNAETAAAGAQESLNLTAEVSGRDMSVINDTFLQSSDWLRWNAGGAMTKIPNVAYPIGTTWDFNLQAGQQDGLWISQSPNTIWPGTRNAPAFVVEIEYSHLSGSLGGAVVLLDWNMTNGTEFRVEKTLSSMQAGQSATPIRQARAVFRRPANTTGTFSSHDLYIMAGFRTDSAAKRLQIHRVRIRPATEEELGSGEVAAGVQANLLVNYLTSAQTNQAVAALEESMTAAMGGSLAAVRRSASAIANLSGSIATFENITTVNGRQRAAGIRATSFDQNGGASGALLELVGDNVVAKGTLSASALVVGLGKNLIPDPQFLNRLQDIGEFVGGGQTATFETRKAPQTFGGAQYPTLMIFQNNTFSGGFADAVFRPVQNEAGDGGFIPCEGNAWYMVSGKVSNHRANGQLIFSWFTSDGTPISSVNSPQFDYGQQSSTNPEEWRRAQFLARAPSNAALMRVHFRKLGTKSGTNSFMFIYKPQVEETHEDATAPTAWDAGGSTYINGSRMITDTFDATRLIRTPDIRAIMGRFGSLTAANISVGVGEVGTIMLNGNAVTVGAGQELGNFIPGNGGWQVANSVSYTLPFAGAVTIQWFASQNYLVRQSQAIGIRLRINGAVQWWRIAGDPNGGATIEQDWLVMGWRRLLGAGTHNIVVDWWSNNANLRLETRSLMVNGAMR